VAIGKSSSSSSSYCFSEEDELFEDFELFELFSEEETDCFFGSVSND